MHRMHREVAVPNFHKEKHQIGLVDEDHIMEVAEG